jgi:transposase
MRFVAVKSEAQQAAAMIFKARDLLVRQRTGAINALRGHLAEFGVIAPKRAHSSQGVSFSCRRTRDCEMGGSSRSRRQNSRAGACCSAREIRQRTQSINALRGHLAEFGVVAPPDYQENRGPARGRSPGPGRC